MKLRFLFYLLLLFCFIAFGCNSDKKRTHQDIRGAWQAIGNDTLYDEVIICDKDYYVYDERAGDIYFNYTIKNDSLTLLRDDFPYYKRRLIPVSKDEFFLVDSLFKIRFTRLKDYVDTARLMTLRNWRKTRTYDEEYQGKYIWELRERRYLWDSLRNASR